MVSHVPVVCVNTVPDTDVPRTVIAADHARRNTFCPAERDDDSRIAIADGGDLAVDAVRAGRAAAQCENILVGITVLNLRAGIITLVIVVEIARSKLKNAQNFFVIGRRTGRDDIGLLAQVIHLLLQKRA